MSENSELDPAEPGFESWRTENSSKAVSGKIRPNYAVLTPNVGPQTLKNGQKPP